MDDKPLTNIKLLRTLVNVYNTRIGAELERYINEQEIKEREEKYRSISDNNLLGIVLTDSNFIIKEVNPAFCQMLGYTKKELLNTSVGDLIVEEYLKQCTELNKKIISGELTFFTIEKRFIKKDGDNVFVHTSAKGVYDDNGKLTACIYTFQDITKRVKAEKSLEQKNVQLKEYIDSNMQLENFAYIASHDMKQPLRTIGNFTGILQSRLKNKLDEKTTDYMNFILEAVKDLNQLIEDLLLYSRINQQHENEEIELALLIEQILRILDQDVKKHEAIVKYANLPEKINGNPTKIKQLFQNLIGNAIKFKQAERVPVVTVVAKDQGEHWLFSVRDNGIGIPKEFHDNVFLLFKQLHHKNAYEGTGIGLALCKMIVEQHGGKIWIDSEPGKGATFHFTIAKHL